MCVFVEYDFKFKIIVNDNFIDSFNLRDNLVDLDFG